MPEEVAEKQRQRGTTSNFHVGINRERHGFPVDCQAAKAGLNIIAGGRAALGFPRPLKAIGLRMIGIGR